MKQEGVRDKELNKIEARLKTRKAVFFDLGKWDEIIGWKICKIEIEEEEERIEVAEKIESKSQEEKKESKRTEQRQKRREEKQEEEKKKKTKEKEIGREVQPPKKKKKKQGKEKSKEKNIEKEMTIQEVLPEGMKIEINRIREKYYTKMQYVESSKKYIKRFDNLEEILLKERNNKRAMAELMLIMINEGHKDVVKNHYPKEYEFINEVIKQYETKAITATTAKEQIDEEFCL